MQDTVCVCATDLIKYKLTAEQMHVYVYSCQGSVGEMYFQSILSRFLFNLEILTYTFESQRNTFICTKNAPLIVHWSNTP